MLQRNAHNDLAFGLHKAAKHYYYPGWQEPGPTLEAIVNADAWKQLPEDLQAVVATACQATGSQMLAEYAARNQQALQTLVDEHDVQLHAFSDEIIEALRSASEQVLEELTADDAFSRKVYDAYKGYRDRVARSTRIMEQAYLNDRERAT